MAEKAIIPFYACQRNQNDPPPDGGGSRIHNGRKGNKPSPTALRSSLPRLSGGGRKRCGYFRLHLLTSVWSSLWALWLSGFSMYSL